MIDHSSEDYRVAVVRALTGADDKMVFNGTIDHAAVVVENAFRVAQDRVRILTNRLDPDCYNRPAVREAALSFLRRPDAHLDVLLEEQGSLDPATDTLIKDLKEVGGVRVRVEKVLAEMIDGYEFNFMTIDDKSYRFESDRTKPIAVVAGGTASHDTVGRLTGIFDRLFQLSQRELVLS